MDKYLALIIKGMRKQRKEIIEDALGCKLMPLPSGFNSYGLTLCIIKSTNNKPKQGVQAA